MSTVQFAAFLGFILIPASASAQTASQQQPQAPVVFQRVEVVATRLPEAGFEISTDLRLPQSAAARVTYSFHDAKFVDFEQEFDGVPTALGGKRIEMSPRQLFGVGFWVASERGLVANVGVKYTGIAT